MWMPTQRTPPPETPVLPIASRRAAKRPFAKSRSAAAPHSKGARSASERALLTCATIVVVVAGGRSSNAQSNEPAQQTHPAATQPKELTLSQILDTPGSLSERLPNAQWIPGSSRWSRLDVQPGDRIRAVSAKSGHTTDLATAAQLNAALKLAGAKISNAKRIPGPFRWAGRDLLRIQIRNAVYHWKCGAKSATKILTIPKGAGARAIHKDDSRIAFVKDHQLWAQIGGGKPQALTKDGSADIVYGGAAHRAEFGIRDGLWWDPTGRFLAFSREDMRTVRTYPYVDHTTMPPRALKGRYPMAGRKNSVVTIGVYDTKSRQSQYLAHAGEKDIYWTNVTFDSNGEKIYVAQVNRAQNHMVLVRFDAVSGQREKELFAERDEQWVEPEHGPVFLPDDSGQFLWFSSRDKHRALYLYEKDGTLLRRVTTGTFDIAEFLGFDPAARTAFVMGSGDNPLQMHLWQVDLELATMRQITTRRGWHSCQLSGDARYVLDRSSNLNDPGCLEVLAVKTGRPPGTQDLTKAGPAPIRVGHKFPVRGTYDFFSVMTPDRTRLHGMTILPPGLDPSRARKASDRKYPVLWWVYGGPHSQLVRDRWHGGSGWNLWLHYMATRGFVVCVLDNRGTDNRGIEFSQAIHRRLGELEVADQILGLREIAQRPYIDPRRIGVVGWSYGGYMTLNLMLRAPGVFACGASGAPVTDWRSYETGYAERYMDTPKENPSGYASSSVLPLAGKLRGRLLVLHGTDDKTVMWSHSLAFVKSCIAKGKLIDYMPYPMQKHGLRGMHRKHMIRTLTRFFTDRLQ